MGKDVGENETPSGMKTRILRLIVKMKICNIVNFSFKTIIHVPTFEIHIINFDIQKNFNLEIWGAT